ncbi:MAG: FmdB family zinc ribbon protein [Thermodesulfobacteriota bacterium]
MPLFEYKCDKCENKFETLVLSSDEEISCPRCESKNIEKLFSSFGFKSKISIPISTSPISSTISGCGCTPVNCGCSVKN